jgi:hypothetical protein
MASVTCPQALSTSNRKSGACLLEEKPKERACCIICMEDIGEVVSDRKLGNFDGGEAGWGGRDEGFMMMKWVMISWSVATGREIDEMFRMEFLAGEEMCRLAGGSG